MGAGVAGREGVGKRLGLKRRIDAFGGGMMKTEKFGMESRVRYRGVS